MKQEIMSAYTAILAEELILATGCTEPIAIAYAAAKLRQTLGVLPETIREYGCVHRVQRSQKDATERFVQDNFYYLCAARDEPVAQRLDAYEARERYTLEYLDPETAIRKNRSVGPTPYDPWMFEREARVLEMLMKEGYFA